MSTYTLPIVGAHFRPPAKAILANLPSSASLRLAPEPTNPYDPNAISVHVSPSEIPESQHQALALTTEGMGFGLDQILEADSWHLGYIPAVNAKDIAPVLSNHLDNLFLTCGQKEDFVSGTLVFAPDGKPQVTFTL
jgi:hypothetical protein